MSEDFVDVRGPTKPNAAPNDPSQCRFCHWWKDTYSSIETRPGSIPSEYARGGCRRRSPKSVKSPFSYGSRETVWPTIEGRDWCGDFERFRNADGTPNIDMHG